MTDTDEKRGTPSGADVPSRRETPAPAAGRKGTVAEFAARRRRRRFWLNAAVIGLTLAAILAAAFWLFSFRIFNIGSNSMAPTLRGMAGNRDHLLCWMLAYHYRQPQRWEVAFFETPSNAASQELLPGLHTGGETGMTIKRIVGLPGERLALADGDIWTRPLRGGGEFTRRTKSDHLQRGLWIPVYSEDFSDIRTDEFLYHWNKSGDGEAAVAPDRTLRFAPAGGLLRLRYRPMIRVGGSGGHRLEELPGIPDRYVLYQEVVFHCGTPDCGTAFSLWVEDQKIQGRCPACGEMALENRVASYGFRSGLAEIGPYAVGRVQQTDPNHFRANSYFFVPDLRVRLEMALAGADSACLVELEEEDRRETLAIDASGMTVNGQKVAGVAGPRPGEFVRIEFYRADGVLRLFVNGAAAPAFQGPVGDPRKPARENTVSATGLSLAARGGGLTVREIGVDRDIYYFSGSEHAILNYLSGMEESGEVDIPEGKFLPLGDNSTVSLDGRSWGPIDISLLRGTAIRIWRPKERVGWIPSPLDRAARE